MANIVITAPLVDGSLMPYISENDSSKETVLFICGDDLRPPPQCVKILVKTESGRVIEVLIPNDSNSLARVAIDGVAV